MTYRPYTVVVRVSGNLNNFDNGSDIQTLLPIGNKKSSEKSIVASIKNTVSLCGCKVEEIISIVKNAH